MLEYAQSIDKDPFDTYFDLLLAAEGGGSALYTCIGQEDIFRLVRSRHVVIGTDGVCLAEGAKVHPRTFGTFPRAIHWFVKEQQILSLQAIVKKMTSLPARRLGLKGKGALRPGSDADLVLFNLDTIQDSYDLSKPYTPNPGIERVYVAGQLAFCDGQLTQWCGGQLLLASR